MTKYAAVLALAALCAAPLRAQDAPAAVPIPLTTVSGTAADSAPIAAPAVAPVIVGASTGHYFRWLDPHHLLVSAGTLYDLSGVEPVSYVTEVALVTHSTTDGSIIPPALQRAGILAEDWTPVQVGFGGSAKVVGGRLTGNALTTFGTAGNVCPWVFGWAVSHIDASSPPALQIVKAAVVGDGTSSPKLRLGYDLEAHAISGGTFQSAKEALPGRGVLDIARRASRFEVSVLKRL